MDSKAIFQLIMWLVKVSLLLSSWYTGVGLTDAPRFYRAVLLIVLKIGIYVVHTWHNDDLLWCKNCIKLANHCTWLNIAAYGISQLITDLIICQLDWSLVSSNTEPPYLGPAWQCFRTHQSISQTSCFFLRRFPLDVAFVQTLNFAPALVENVQFPNNWISVRSFKRMVKVRSHMWALNLLPGSFH